MVVVIKKVENETKNDDDPIAGGSSIVAVLQSSTIDYGKILGNPLAKNIEVIYTGC